MEYIRFAYDIEIYQNFFCVTFLDYHSENKIIFEISERINQYEELVEYMNSIPRTSYGISFNGIDYDNLILNRLVKGRYTQANYLKITRELKDFSDYVILNKDDFDYYEQIKKYKWGHNWIDVDLLRYWSMGLRKTKQLSLKSLAVQLNYPVIMELPIHHTKSVKKAEIPLILEYNSVHDVGVTKLLAQKMRDDIKFRVSIEKQYKVKCMSWDSPKIASNLIKNEIESKGIKTRDSDGVVINTNRKKVCIGETLLQYNFKGSYNKPEIEIKIKKDPITGVKKKIVYRTYKNSLSLHEDLKVWCVSTTKEVNAIIPLTNPDGSILECIIGSGGAHAALEGQNQYHIEDNDFIIKDLDYGSFYPSLLILLGLTPEHLGSVFLDLYKRILSERLAAKKRGDKVETDIKKLLLNSTYGMLNNDYSFLKDMKQSLGICFNGQLILLYLTERIIEWGGNVIMQNTDGLTVKIPRSKEKEFQSFVESINPVDIPLEFVNYKKLIMLNVNGYIALTDDGKVKKKGKAFRTDVPLGDSVDFLIIPKILELYFIKGLDPKKVITNYKDYGFNIYDLCGSFKVAKSYQVIYNGKIQQQLNRFYVSKKGAYLYKQKNTKDTPDNMLKGYAVNIFNNYEEKEDYEIDYSFYLKKINDVIYDIEKYQKQLTLF